MDCMASGHLAPIELTCLYQMVSQQSVMLIGSPLEEITCILTIKRRMKGSSSKIPVNCPNGIKLYNTKMGGVDLMDQLKSAYQLD